VRGKLSQNCAGLLFRIEACEDAGPGSRHSCLTESSEPHKGCIDGWIEASDEIFTVTPSAYPS